MGEQACPVQDSGCQKVDPVALMRESVSFGRFVSESLDWGKWSSFCQNRYLEEAEKHSTKGSVALMKAKFEAHYKGIAAKKAEALREQTNDVNETNAGSQTRNGSYGDDDLDSGVVKSHFADNGVHMDHSDITASDGHVGIVSIETEITGSNDNSKEKLDTQSELAEENCDSSISEMEGMGTSAILNGCCFIESENLDESTHVLEREVNLKFKSECELPSKMGDVENQNVKVEMVNIKGYTEKQNLPLKETLSCNQEIRSLPPVKSNFSISKPSFHKKPHNAPPFPTNPTSPALHKKENIAAMRSKNSLNVKNSSDKKKSTSKSLHMLVSDHSYKKDEVTVLEKKASPPVERMRDARVTFSCCKSFQDFSSPCRALTRVSANGTSKLAQVAPQPESRRKIPSQKTDLSTRKSDEKSQLVIADCRKSPNDSSRKSSASSRAEKRREYYLKLEERLNAEKLERQAKEKEKAENELKLLRQSLGFKARPMPDFYQKREQQKLEVNKTPLTGPLPAKLLRNRGTKDDQATKSLLPPLRTTIKCDKTKQNNEKVNQGQVCRLLPLQRR